MKKVIYLLLISVTLGFTHTSFSQLTSEEIRDATAAGPYPLYVTLQFARSATMSDFKNLSKEFNRISPNSSNDKKVLRGIEGNLGFTINEKWLQNVYLEGGYQLLHRKLKDDAFSINVTNQVASLRYGVRRRIFYPLTFQFQVGPILYRRQTFTLDSMAFSATPSLRRVFFTDKISFKDGIHIPGWEGRGRLVLLDPVGTSGGLGFFIEWRIVEFSRKRSLDILYDALDPGGTSNVTDQTDDMMFSFSFGLVAPLALRIK